MSRDDAAGLVTCCGAQTVGVLHTYYVETMIGRLASPLFIQASRSR